MAKTSDEVLAELPKGLRIWRHSGEGAARWYVLEDARAGLPEEGDVYLTDLAVLKPEGRNNKASDRGSVL